MKINSKARTLKNLNIDGVNVPKLKIYSSKSFILNKNNILKDIKRKFKSTIAIRSSSYDEDQPNKSNAGKYRSFLNVNSKNQNEVKNRIEEVIKSYEKKKRNSEFFIQQMVKNIRISGVVLTRELESYLPCYNINYYIGKDSSAVTSGKSGSRNIIYIENKKYKLNSKFEKLVTIIKKIKKKTKESDLDVEFAIDKNEKIFVLQVRKLVTKSINKDLNPKILFPKLEKKINKLKQKHYSLVGNTTFFGVMPDWNPAEIIGIKPRPLALSMYQELITNHVWSENRKIYGYKDLSQFHLMTTFYGTPFIDVRIDFNSWLPSTLPTSLSKKIVNFYLKTFKEKKYLHDKVEFEILLTCYTLNTEKKISDRFKNLLNKKEKKVLINCLREINSKANQQMYKEYNLISKLIGKQNNINNSSLYYLDKIYWLIEDCKKYGTLPFAGLARCAFIATEILNSFVEEKILSNNEKIHFPDFKSPNLVIKKIIRSSISDLICKGVKPEYYFISGSGNKNHFTKKNLKIISKSLNQEQKKYNLKLSGGDTTNSNKISFSITTIGYSKNISL